MHYYGKIKIIVPWFANTLARLYSGTAKVETLQLTALFTAYTAIGHGVLLSYWRLESVKLNGFSSFGGFDDSKVLNSTDIIFSLTVVPRYHYIK